MQEHKGKVAANGADHFRLGRRQRRVGWKDVCPVPHNHNPGRLHPFADNPRAHILSENDDSRCPPQRPAMHLLPNTCQQPRLDDRAPHGHVWVHVADVVNVGLALQQRHKRTRNAAERRIGHRQNRVARNE